MTKIIEDPSCSETALGYQKRALQKVSRTFALTIPQLPRALELAVGNAYLIFRALDTIEDDVQLDLEQKGHYGEALVKIIVGNGCAEDFASELTPLLSPKTSSAERDLMQHLPLVIEIKRSLNTVQQCAIERCARIMWYGMYHFLHKAGLHGLDSERDLDAFCYYGAGVVGELLTDLFCDYSSEIANKRPEIYQLSSAFGKGLQLTNILKDQWEDRERNVCWLPHDLFLNYGVELGQLEHYSNPFGNAQASLLGIAHTHIRSALRYTLLIPSRETGIRRFCYWTLSLAVMTLGNIYRKPDFTKGSEIKMSRGKVTMMITLTHMACWSDNLLKGLFKRYAKGLPLSLPAYDLRETGEYPNGLR